MVRTRNRSFFIRKNERKYINDELWRSFRSRKKGQKIAREGWNGKNVFVVYQQGYPQGIATNAHTSEAYGVPEGTILIVRPYLQMYCADGSLQMWLASQSDVLAEDWTAV